MATVMIAAIRAKSGHNMAERKPLTSLLTVSRNLTKVLNERCSAEAGTQDYLDQLTALTVVPAHSG